MTTAAFGESHSLVRYFIFGAIAGVLSGVVIAAFGLSLPLVAIPAAAIAALSAGHRAT